MGLGVGDYLNNGRVDVLVTDFSDDYKALYRNDGDASFTEAARDAGIAQIAVPFVGWGAGLYRLRQRRMEGCDDGQRPRLSPG